jgi:pimeloyl-ACP methyl ester carboxylesterase
MPGDLDTVTRVPERTLTPTTLVLIHGAWHGSWCWERFQHYFAEQGYASTAVNLRGHGASDGRDKLRWTSASEYVKDMEEVVDQMPGPAVLIGHSMGGYLIQKYLESRPAAAAVLLASIPARGAFRMFNRLAVRKPWRTLKMHLSRDPFVLIETPCLAQEALFSADMSAQEVGEHFARLQPESYRVGWDLSVLNLPRPKQMYRIPMLVLGGQNDNLILASETEETAAAYGVKAEFFENMAHDMMLEKDWLRVAERITAWLRDHNL